MEKRPFYNRIEEFIMIALLAAIVVILFFSVITRYVFNFTFSWAEEISRFFLVWAMCAGISWAGYVGQHLVVDALATAFHKKAPNLESGIFWIGDFLNVLFGAYMAYRLWIISETVMKSNQVFTSMPWLPKWLMYFAGVLGMSGMCIRIIQRRAELLLNKKKEAK
ncbi:TRAP transporter small permease [Anaerotruncus rubiinfantis]|jgi:C4-dicarboxylate transporter DctQ subunit|uniref:TRAP transporter small permease n=1 Tax=Anaerotruncus rubiinfantis TaxID=1720200 RepID=UPI0008367B3F|nr:TRAP transporter small permease [Anaerotruncus rubiinfantis]